jgi:hypothetical protein
VLGVENGTVLEHVAKHDNQMDREDGDVLKKRGGKVGSTSVGIGEGNAGGSSEGEAQRGWTIFIAGVLRKL